MINFRGTFESNYYQGKQSYRTVAKIAKNFAETGINNYVQSFCETTPRFMTYVTWFMMKLKYNKTFHQKLESVQYNACLALSEAIRGSSREKLYQELGLESLQRLH